MFNGKKILGLIPARGGSKGVPGKNIRELAGRPLIGYTIECALASGVIDRLICSTDSEEIAGVAERFGAGVPFMRPPELATDSASGMDVIIHAMEWTEKNDPGDYQCIMVLQPTSPLRKPEDILRSLELMEIRKANVVLSVCEADHPPLWMNTLPEDMCMKDFVRPEARSAASRQQLPLYYRLNGAIYLSRWDYLKENKNFFSGKTYAYAMPAERSLDIDSLYDFKLAEFLIGCY